MRCRSLEVAWLVLSCGGCGWAPLDAIVPIDGSVGAPRDDATSPASDAATSRGDATSTGDAAVGDGGGAADASEEGDAAMDASEDGAASSGAPCNAAGAAVDEWTFDATAQSWVLATDTGVTGSVTWTSSTGDPSTGALQVDVTPALSDAGSASGVWLQVDGSYGDLAGRTVTAWVWLDSGDSPQLKVFTQSNPQYGWEDNGTLTLPTKAWTCVSLPVSTPSYEQAWFDPTSVIRIGFEMLSATPFRVYVDTVRVR